MKRRTFGIVLVLAMSIVSGALWMGEANAKGAREGNSAPGVNQYQYNNSWNWHAKGGFRYPKSFSRTETFVDDVPADVEVFTDGKVQLCYWPLLGSWSTYDFPKPGDWISPTEKIKNIVYRAKSKRIVSGYTQMGNIYYLKQKIIRGGEVNHSKVLVLINPPALKDKVTTLTNDVAKW